MAWLERKGGIYLVCFRLDNQRFKRSLDTSEEDDAVAQKQRLEQNIRLYERGRFDIPKDVDVVSYLLSDGRRDGKPSLVKPTTLVKLFKLYFDSIPAGSLEATTINGMKIHQKHLQRHLGASFNVRNLSKDDLQGFINARAKDKGRSGFVSPMTIKKEVVTLRTVWNCAGKTHVEGPFPSKGLKYPKSTEKPPFMAFSEVEARTKDLSDEDAAELWESVYLTVDDLDALFKHVGNARLAFVYPMFVFAAHTGARRSEIARCRVSDIDLKNGWVTLRERKKAHDRKTTRRVPISAKLHTALSDWFLEHPGGDALFCHAGHLARSKKRSPTTGHKWKNRPTTIGVRMAPVIQRVRPEISPLTRDELHDHFKRALASTRWARLKGFHVLRHSFISCLASSGADQRLIDEWSGHMTDEQRRRYRHLFPSVARNEVKRVFG